MLPVNAGSVKGLISQKWKVTNNDARLILRKKLNGQRHYNICRWWLGGGGCVIWNIWSGVRANLSLLRGGYCVIFLIAKLIFCSPPLNVIYLFSFLSFFLFLFCVFIFDRLEAVLSIFTPQCSP